MASIKTKYNVGDKAFTFDPATLKAVEFQVAAISVWAKEKSTDISYYPTDKDGKVDYMTRFEDRFCFASQDDMLNYITSR